MKESLFHSNELYYSQSTSPLIGTLTIRQKSLILGHVRESLEALASTLQEYLLQRLFLKYPTIPLPVQ